MSRPDLSQHLSTVDKAVAQQEQAGRRRRPRPLPPPMRTVTKGWQVLHEGQTAAEDLAKARRDRR